MTAAPTRTLMPPGIDPTHTCIEYRVVNVTLRYNATFIERQKATLIMIKN